MLDQLVHDGLLLYRDSTDAQATPAHDVLEDWALIRWVDECSILAEDDPTRVAEAIDTYPALRRAYRKWLAELLECEPAKGDRFASATLSNASLPNYFRDDTLTAILMTAGGVGFLQRNTDVLVANNAALLLRSIHLLRVACKAPPSWLGGNSASVHYLIPSGPAWAPLLAVGAKTLTDFCHRISGWS